MDANMESHFIWHEVGVKWSASFEVVHDSREDCARSQWINIAANLCFKLMILWNARCHQCETSNALSNMGMLNFVYIELSLAQNVCPSHNWSWCLLILAVIYDIFSYLFVANVFVTLYLWCASSYSIEIDMWKVAKRVMVCKKIPNSFH